MCRYRSYPSLSRYAGADPAHAPPHKLGTDRWSKTRKKAAEQIRDTLDRIAEPIRAPRALRQGHAFPLDKRITKSSPMILALKPRPINDGAIAAVTHDLIAAKPMDRLVCGDVGFGKTGVALRAHSSPRWVANRFAVLAPTAVCWLSNITKRFPTALPNGRFALPGCRVSCPVKRPPKYWKD